MTSTPRLCLLGIDAADESLVERWCAEGILPTLDRLRRAGTRVALRNAEATPSGAVWPTIYTGTHPGRHGIVHPLAIVPGTLRLQSIDPETCPEPPVWALLAAAGLRSIVVDVPFAPLGQHPGSLHVVNWAAYERLHGPRSWPAGLLGDVERQAGLYPLQRDLSCNPAVTEAEHRRDHAQLVAGVAVKGAALRWLLRHHPWDFCMATFTEAHAVGHHFWDLAPTARADAHAESLTSPVADVYRSIDAELGKLVSELDLTTTTLLVMSGHGMGPNVDGCHLVEPVLRAAGLLVAPPPTAGSVLGRLRGACPAWVRRSVSRRLPRAVRTSMSQYWMLGGFDHRRTRAFALPSDQLGFVRINVAGREPVGPVQPRGEYEALSAEVAGALRRLTDPATGRPVVRDVIHADQAFPGPLRHRLPDLLVRWDDAAPIEAVQCADGTRLAGRSSDSRRGNHRPDGFAIVVGAGDRSRETVRGHLLDIAPTVLQHFGLTSPSTMTGRAWTPSPEPAEASVIAEQA